MVALLPAVVCLIGFSVSMVSCVTCAPHPCVRQPQKTKYLGYLAFLTIHTNLINTIYFLLAVCATLSGSAALEAFVVRLSGLAFALGALLSPLYYGADHFTAEKRILDAKWIKSYPYIYIGNHLDHGLALPLTFLHARAATEAPSTYDVYLFVGGYVGFYLSLTFWNKMMTKRWIYPIFDEAEAALGFVGPFLVMTIVSAIVIGLGLLGQVMLGP